MRTIFLGILTLVFFANNSFADHSPKKMMRNMKAFSQLSTTGKLGSDDVNFFLYGKIPNSEPTSISNKKFDKVLADKMNLAAIVMSDGVSASMGISRKFCG